ncbi:MAG: nascent polypeptide-associated complex protein [Methanomassiliicoccales archaeon]|nr:MAG: nascent polypeptide-associated complex protein [Methanomassiliicoccales archaeon]
MMPGMGRVNPRQMKQAMKRLGISAEELNDVEEVVIKRKGSEMVISNPQVSIMTMQGQKTFQIVGEVNERAKSSIVDAKPERAEIPEEDVELVMGQTGCSRERAIEALKAAEGQPAEAILKLMSS